MEQALALAEPEGYLQPVPGGRRTVRELLAWRIRAGTAHRALAGELGEAIDPGSDRHSSGATRCCSSRLRPRDSVLRYLPTGLSKAEIAAEMFVSVNTVKTHMKNIYRKLDVTDRGQAVRRARSYTWSEAPGACTGKRRRAIPPGSLQESRPISPRPEEHVSRRAVIVRYQKCLLGLLAVAVQCSAVPREETGSARSPRTPAPYLGGALLVFLDAVCPIFPGETTLNAASTPAANGKFHLWLVIVAGAVGAILGDSALYWMARLFSMRLAPGAEKTKRSETVAEALAFLGDSAPLLLTAGRFVPGVRFVVNATLGAAKFPYGRFAL